MFVLTPAEELRSQLEASAAPFDKASSLCCDQPEIDEVPVRPNKETTRMCRTAADRGYHLFEWGDAALEVSCDGLTSRGSQRTNAQNGSSSGRLVKQGCREAHGEASDHTQQATEVTETSGGAFRSFESQHRSAHST